MTQITYRANLSSAIYPLTLAKSGRTVIIPGPDQNFDKRVDSPGDSTRAVGIPQAIYMENVLPTPDGFQSVGFKPVEAITAPTTSITTVETVRLAVTSDSTTITDDVDVTDVGTNAADWTKSANNNYIGGAPPSGTADIPFWLSSTANPSAGGNPTNYYEFSTLRWGGPSETNRPAFWQKAFEVYTSSDVEIDVEVIFIPSDFSVAQAVADAYPEKVFIIGVCGLSNYSGIKIIYRSTDNTIRVCNRANFSVESFTSEASGTVAALNFSEWYSVNIAAIKDSAGNLTVTATIRNAATTIQGTVTAFYAAGTYPFGNFIGIGRQGRLLTGSVESFTEPLTYGAYSGTEPAFVLLTNAGAAALGTYAAQKTGFDNLHVVASIPDSTSIVVSGIVNINIAFNADATVTATWSRSSAEDWESNPISSAAQLTVDNTTLFSTTTVRGICYVCLREAGTTKIYELSISDSPAPDTLLFTDRTSDIGGSFSSSFSVDDILGISGSFNYLLLHTATVVFWSSTTTPTDFAASLVSGAGSETPGNLKGDISFIKEHVAGFYIYTTNNVVFAAYTGNRAYPWKFREIAGSGGFSFNSQVSGDTNASVHYGLNNARFIQVLAPNEANVQSPEVTDFLERVKRWDIFNYSTNTFSTFSDTPGNPTSLINLAEPRIWFVLDRYILLPYGVVSDQYTYCLVFDALLNRYGKLKFTFNSITTDETNIYFLDYETRARKKLYFDMQYSGTAQSEAFQHQGVLVLGKFQLARGDFIQLEEVEIESAVTDSPGDFTVHLLPTLDGKTFTAAVPLTKTINSNPDIAFYFAHTVGQNVSILCKGAFDLNTVQLVAQNAGTN